MPIRRNRTKQGFTLVEMLVVLAIIGILAAILVPTLAIAVRTVNQGAIRVEMRQIESALEQYKNKYGGYPLQVYGPNLRYGSNAVANPWLVKHFQGVSRRTNVVLLTAFATSDLETPPDYVASYGSPPTRNAATMGPAEALVFALSEVSQNASSPMGYLAASTRTSGLDLTDPTMNDRQVFYEFNQSRLGDRDQDGWLEYYSKSDSQIPLLYYDSRVYTASLATVGDADVKLALLVSDYETGAGGSAAEYPYRVTGIVGSGYGMPYGLGDALAKQNGTWKWGGLDSYQLISPGVDEQFSNDTSWIGSAVPRIIPADLQQLVFDKDNLASFAELRLDALGTE